jgi:hypothetical protein
MDARGTSEKGRLCFLYSENGKDILSVCQSNPGGDVRHDIIIQRGPKEFDFLIEHPGPRISYEDLGLDLVPGPESIRFSSDLMVITVAGHKDIQVDLSALDHNSRKQLRKAAKKLFR